MAKKTELYDNGFFDYIIDNGEFRELIDDYKETNSRKDNTFYSIMYCHAITLFETYIGETVEYQRTKYGELQEKHLSLLTPITIKKCFRKLFNIDIEIPPLYEEAVKTRHRIIHRNGYERNRKIRITKNDVIQLSSCIRQMVIDIQEKLTEEKANNIIHKQ